MSDGASEGYRSAREHEARQKSIDTFFGAVWWEIDHRKGPRAGKKLREAFDTFDAHRYADNIACHRIAKGRDKRWKAFVSWLGDACDRPADARVMKAWTEILALALRFASSDVTERLKDASPFEAYRIALVVPNGTGYWGHRSPDLLGDLEGALDALVGAPRPDVYAAIVEDAERAVVGLTQGGGRSEENREEERAKLRFLAVKAP